MPRDAEAGQLGSRRTGREHLMTLITSARIRALSIISITVIVVLLFLSSAVQATGDVTETVTYRVKPGDTLWQIAKSYGPQNTDTRRIVAAIEKLNEIDGALLQSGQVIEVPAASSKN
jgi:nucleoid-associated protein YgaU